MTQGSARAAHIDADDVRRGVVIDLAGVALALRAPDAEHAEAVASLFRHAARSPDPPTAVVRFEVDGVAPPTSPPTVTVPHATLWYDDAGALIVRSRDGLIARADRDSLLVGGTCEGLARAFRFICLGALTHLLSGHGWYLVHGAALGVSNGALLVLGGTGTGKSTLAYAALRRSRPVLADDAVLLQQRNGAVSVRGFPRPIAVPADVIGAATDAGADGGQPVPEDPRARTELAPGTLTAGGLPVVALLVTRGRGTGTARHPHLDPLPAQEAFRSVLSACTSLADPTHRRGLFRIAGILARVPAWSLGQAADAADALGHATRALEALDHAIGSADRRGEASVD